MTCSNSTNIHTFVLVSRMRIFKDIWVLSVSKSVLDAQSNDSNTTYQQNLFADGINLYLAEFLFF